MIDRTAYNATRIVDAAVTILALGDVVDAASLELAIRHLRTDLSRLGAGPESVRMRRMIEILESMR